MFRLDDRVALVTGAARGVGAQIAKTLAEAGARVVLADILVTEGEKVASEIGDAAHFESLDVTEEEDWARVIESTVERLGRVEHERHRRGALRDVPGSVHEGAAGHAAGAVARVGPEMTAEILASVGVEEAVRFPDERDAAMCAAVSANVLPRKPPL